MFEVTETADLDIDAESAWRAVGDFGAVGHWHPMLAEVRSEGNTTGARRHVTATDGSKQVERLDSYDPQRHCYRYHMESTGLPVRDYVAEFRIDGDGRHHSKATWSAYFAVTGRNGREGVQAIREFLKAGVEALERRYAVVHSDG
jgi:mxaD protein